jgi:hypothetical protein
VPGHARTPGRHHRLGGPLPRQLPNTTTARPTAPELWSRADAGPRRRWGLPAVSRGYTRPWGWLPSPYSPLRHWPGPKAGPVRLACLIHAANVHSEPGSNPSQWRRPTLTPGGAPRRPIPTSKRLRNSDWSHRDGLQGAWQPPSPAPTPVHAGHPAAGAHRTRWASRPGTAARTPAPLKGRSQRDGGSHSSRRVLALSHSRLG